MSSLAKRANIRKDSPSSGEDEKQQEDGEQEKEKEARGQNAG
jgi:hypothetical protein